MDAFISKYSDVREFSLGLGLIVDVIGGEAGVTLLVAWVAETRYGGHRKWRESMRFHMLHRVLEERREIIYVLPVTSV